MSTRIFHAGGLQFELEGELSGWTIDFQEEVRETGLSILHFELNSETERSLPKLALSFRWPQKDIQVRWTPEMPANHHLLPYWWNGGNIVTNLCRNAPVFSYLNLEGENRITYAFSEAEQQVLTHTGPTENSYLINRIQCFLQPLPPVRKKRISLRFDRRKIHYSEALHDVSLWYEEILPHPPLPVPAAARKPVYSTWYQFQREVTAKQLEQELPVARACGLSTFILDDGWSYAGATVPGTFAHAGDWKAAPEKFPDMPGHIQKAHQEGMHYLVWFPLPFIGRLAEKDFARFQGKFLSRGPHCGVLDPRFPEVRSYLEELCEHFVREWNLDGLKLDFLDNIQLPDPDPAESDGAGRDYRSLPDAIEALLCGILTRLRRIKPDLLIEFRQKYIGPAMRAYGNIFRASDCAMDLLENRVRILDLRLLSGGTAVHSDMLIWSPDDTPEVAALQILNVIFATPQISCMLTELPDDHRKMLKFWMKFCVSHVQTLQESPIRPEHPELSYPLVSAEGDEEIITAVYLTGQRIRIHPKKRHIILNAKHSEELLIKTDSPLAIRRFNVFGEEISPESLSAGLHRITVPPSGFALCNN